MPRRDKQIELNFTEVDSIADSSDDHAKLISMAENASELAYVPYSRFNAGAAAQLDNGKVLIGSNK